jgi:hypothetical protein
MNSESAGGSGVCDATAVGIIRAARRSAVFESKVSRSDFFADRKKWHRRRRHHRVSEEWYVTPSGLVTVSELPDGWGLLEADVNGRLSITRRAEIHELTHEDFQHALMLCSKACAQKYITALDCHWKHHRIELNADTWRSA